MMLQAALREAAVRRHSHVTVEHVLYAMIHDTAGAEILRQGEFGPGLPYVYLRDPDGNLVEISTYG